MSGEPRRAAFVPDRVVRLAVVALPAASRARYEREFLSELFGLGPWQQTRYALDVLIQIPRLRLALRDQPRPSEIAVSVATHRPLLCRLNLHHHWVAMTTADHNSYHQCSRCRKDRTEFDANEKDPADTYAQAGVIGGTFGPYY